MKNPSFRRLNLSMILRSNMGISALVVLAFVFGIIVGKQSNIPVINNPATLLAHGSVLHLDDLPYKSTVHNDKQGSPIRKKQFIQPFIIPNLSGFQVATLTDGQTVETHAHESMHEIFYVLSGLGTFEVDGKAHSVSPGTMVHLAPHEIHSIRTNDSDLTVAYFGITI